jgi:hypothetical protein
MGGNYPWFQVTDLTAEDTTVKHGETTTVTVKFSCTGDPQADFYTERDWPFTVKVYLEGFGPGTARERIWTDPGNLEKDEPDYEHKVEIGPLDLEGVYEVGALVELDDDAGFVMGHYDGDLKISIWTPY